MIKLIIDKLPRITKNREKLEKRLNVKITNRGKEVYIDGDAEDEYIAEKVIKALDFGFPFSIALLIKDQEYEFEVLNIKNHTRKKDFKRIKARIIGAGGKTIKTLSELTKCDFEIKDNFVGIIGDAEYLENGQQGIISLIQGSKQGNVYSYLEKHQIKPVIDLGLKEVKNKKSSAKS
ncbi:MAG TPA: hypothetical protein VJH92_04890 [Candidatus Nanoarchaeia archaeon]|nr:hypothetical protein [Candidatus Nanoarchaeia archaeon]